MLNLTQTVEYVNLCKIAGIPVIPRTKAQLYSEMSNILNPNHRYEFEQLVMTADTAEAYVELLRIQVSLRALKVLPKHHPSAMVNITNFQDMVKSCATSDELICKATPYNLGDLTLYGAFIPIAKLYHDIIFEKGLLDNVYSACNLGRLMGLHDFLNGNHSKSNVTYVTTPVYNNYNERRHAQR